MSIFKLQSGLIFDDQFQDIDPRWIISPSGSISLQDKQLVFNHSDGQDGTKALFELPQEENLLFQVEAEYIPTEYGDEGGLVIWNSSLNKLEFLESVEVKRTDEYSVWQARKRGNLWSFHALRNSSWEMFDSAVIMDAQMAGIVLKGNPSEKFVPLQANRTIVCKGSFVTVGNLGGGYRVELLDENDSVVKYQIIPDLYAGTNIELPFVPFKGRLKIYDVPTEEFPEGRPISEQIEALDFYGGDIFLYGTELAIERNGEELNVNGVTDMGRMQNNTILQKMTLKNYTSGNVAENVELSVKQYSNEFGWTWVDIAIDVDGSPGEWSKLVPFGSLQPNEQKDFWVKIERNTEDWATKPTHFIFDLNNQ